MSYLRGVYTNIINKKNIDIRTLKCRGIKKLSLYFGHTSYVYNYFCV